jgi:hypothetical protein
MMKKLVSISTFLIFFLVMFISVHAQKGKVYVVLFMHNEDNVFGNINDPESLSIYLRHRQGLVEMSQYLHDYSVPFAWQSDWKYLEAILKFETPELKSETNGKNLARWMKEDMNISVDAHSHENFGYNYADVACLIDSLGVSPPDIIGGHIWDPYNNRYAHWERFRKPLRGNQFPHYIWNGSVLIGSGTPGHTYDPEPSGIWRPFNKYNYWQNDPQGSVLCVGQYTGDVEGVRELVRLYKTVKVSEDSILTCTIHTPQGFPLGFMDDFRSNLVEPLLAMQERGEIKIVDFVELVKIWEYEYKGKTHLYNKPAYRVPEQFDVRIPSVTGGVKGIYARLSLPQSSRYSDGKSPVVVHVPGGWDGLGVFNQSRGFSNQGFIEIDFNFPGSGFQIEKSGGQYDERGPNSIRAILDVVKFSMGLKEDTYGYKISDMIGNISADPYNVGLCGWSNGGNATIATAGVYGNQLPELGWIVNWESPVGDGMPNVDAGVNSKPNPAYDPTTGKFDVSLLRFDQLLETNEGDLGAFYFDINGNEDFNLVTDYPANYHYFLGRCYYSEWIRDAADNLGISYPDHIASAQETRVFWYYRNGEKWIDSVLYHNPELMFIVEAGVVDHVQGAPDHPHILNQYNGFLDANARFIRLNPDRSYVEDIVGREVEDAADNDGFEVFNRQNIKNALQPRNIHDFTYEWSVMAAACELADRTRNDNIDPQIDASTGMHEIIIPPSTINEVYNYPNPFLYSTNILFNLSKKCFVNFTIYNYNGQPVLTLINSLLSPGKYQLEWTDTNKYAPGVYYGKITSGEVSVYIKMILVH